MVQHDEWAEDRRYLSLDVLAPAQQPATDQEAPAAQLEPQLPELNGAAA